MQVARPSHLQSAARCELKWLFAPDEPSHAMQFGTAVHALLEAFYKGETDPPRAAAEALGPDSPCYASLRGAGWRSPVGRCTMAGLPYLPRPDRCDVIISEGPAIVPGEPPIAGTRDLLVKLQHEECMRLDVKHEWLVVDFKTSANPLLYAKSATELRRDSQGLTYPYAAMLDQGLDVVSCRWVYMPSRAPFIGANHTDFIQRRTTLERKAIPALQARAKRCLTIVRDPSLATRNPEACRDWNRLCPLHVDAGGQCNPNESETDMGALANKIKAMREQGADVEVEPTPEPKAKREPIPRPVKASRAKLGPEPGPEPASVMAETDQGISFNATVSAGYFNADGSVPTAELSVDSGTIIPVGARVRVTVLP